MRNVNLWVLEMKKLDSHTAGRKIVRKITRKIAMKAS